MSLFCLDRFAGLQDIRHLLLNVDWPLLSAAHQWQVAKEYSRKTTAHNIDQDGQGCDGE